MLSVTLSYDPGRQRQTQSQHQTTKEAATMDEYVVVVVVGLVGVAAGEWTLSR